MLNVAICDAELDLVKEIEQRAAVEGTRQNVSVQSSCYQMMDAMLWDMESRGGFDIVFMGILDRKEIETARQIEKMNPHCLIIFMADTAALAYDTFEVHPFSYLKKPIEWEQFHRIFREACTRIKKQDEVFRFCSNRFYYQIPMSSILYFQSERRKIRLYCQNGEEILFYNTLNIVEEYIQELSSRFVRIHHSFLINKMHIERYCYEEIQMINGVKLPISSDKRKMVKTNIMTGNICVI